MRLSILPGLLLLLATPARADCVVLLHGLSRSEYSMLVIEEVLGFHGYRVVNQTYPSESAPIADLIAHVGRSAALCGEERTHFVTHSLGGILARAWLRDNRPPDMGRVVMLAPPNAGTEIVDRLSEREPLQEIMEFLSGPAVLELGTGPDSVPAGLGPVDFELGVIAGNRAISPLGPILLDGPNDGTVSVESTMVEGMADHIVVPATHTLLMNNPVVLAEILEFLRYGAFDHGITLAAAIRKLTQR
jgi:triacylglycerol esterase/lipase EstA (alpha/beta hydrolase family)